MAVEKVTVTMTPLLTRRHQGVREQAVLCRAPTSSGNALCVRAYVESWKGEADGGVHPSRTPRLSKATQFTHSHAAGKREPAQSDHHLSSLTLATQLRKTVKYLLRAYCVPGTVHGPGDTAMDRTGKEPVLGSWRTMRGDWPQTRNTSLR